MRIFDLRPTICVSTMPQSLSSHEQQQKPVTETFEHRTICKNFMVGQMYSSTYRPMQGRSANMVQAVDFHIV